MSDRIYNFSAGPAVLPEPVLKQAQQDLWNIGGSGIGIMEHSHRGKLFEKIVAEAEQDCRELAGMSDRYKILFLQGGASLQFAMVPLNLLPKGGTADYINTGTWSEKAIKEAKLVGKPHEAASSADRKFNYIPSAQQIRYSERPAYVHLRPTTRSRELNSRPSRRCRRAFHLSRIRRATCLAGPIDVSKYGLIYAGAQKNLGRLVLCWSSSGTTWWNWAPRTFRPCCSTGPTSASIRFTNTPPTLGIYMIGRVFKWIRELGGLRSMAEQNAEKAKVLYDFLDQSDFFRGTAEPESRSLMNVCFRAPTEDSKPSLSPRRPSGASMG
jgi:phosphoserine aminotransferase